MIREKTAILIHGCHVDAEGWERIIWGDPEKGLLGRIPTGIALALSEEADLIFWGTGASERNGKKESQIIFQYALRHLEELPALFERAGRVTYRKYPTPFELEKLLPKISYIDLVTQNTAQEVEAAAAECRARGITRLILVSSPTHIGRCRQDADKLRAEGKLRDLWVFDFSSDTCFEGTTPGDVVIIEPPHRGDMPKWQTYRYARAMFGIMKRGEVVYEEFLRAFGQLLITFGVTVDWRPRL
ncbi:MAG: hypothetical protein A2722_03450 [Candidatus Doudnabacteria bacterium RIFCSPHIGHO2_01_FULL_50_11]|uniref:DUF218 domain-containing protein n=1 Tax=Candidatus Doudnabacteria bacterium RIFCSPHIGHO2_01_FULL_50_11 TaxID=1817828 RepID=A0A1F5PJ44_9BACT|nr:MAG: hypothetical protein A2722_03450 [Candidatus Doudnabacteria bacterium RIFCSPHIGHO2_01_FULL_50_11]HLC44283.1 hypothetical protein [Patescibacteria group bacterium]